MPSLTPEQIDELLPQTQCGLCGYGGCMPYAKAIVFEKAALNLCPPGGVSTLKKLGTLVQQNIDEHLAGMQEKTKPRSLAVIREKECIGCTKCIQVCPVDAILGGPKQMHTVIAPECTGCDLCLPACPVDCIDIFSLPPLEDQELTIKANHARQRYQAHQKRIEQSASQLVDIKKKSSTDDKKSYIQEAIARAKAKKEKNN